MALEKSIMTRIGTGATYWSISFIQLDKFAKQAYIILYGFYDKNASELAKEGKATYMDKREYNIYPNEFDTYFSINELNEEGKNQFKIGYTFIKEKDMDFIDALDV